MKKLIKYFKENSIGNSELKLILYLARNPSKNLQDILNNNVFWYPTLKKTLDKLLKLNLISAYEDIGTQNYRSIHYSLSIKNPIAKIFFENQSIVEKLLEVKCSPKHIILMDYFIEHSTEVMDIAHMNKKFKSIGYSRVVKTMEQFASWNVLKQFKKVSTDIDIDKMYLYPFDYTYNPNSELSKFMEKETEIEIQPPISILSSISNISNNISKNIVNTKPQSI